MTTFRFASGATRKIRDGREHILDGHREESRVRFGREGLASAQTGVGQHDVRAGRRAPLLRWSRAEERDGGDAVRRREVSGTRVRGDDEVCVSHLGGELIEAHAARENAVFGHPRLGCDGQRALTLRFAAREYDGATIGGERFCDESEAIDGPTARTVEGADVHDGRVGNGRSHDGNLDRDVIFVSRHPERVDEPHPSSPLEHPIDPRGTGAAVRDDLAGVEARNGTATLGTVAVHVDRDVDLAGDDAERVVEPRRGMQLVDAADELDDRPQPGGHREDESVIGVRTPNGMDRRNCDEQVSKLQGTQDKDLRNLRQVGGHDRHSHRIPQRLARGGAGSLRRSRAFRVEGLRTARFGETESMTELTIPRAVLFDRDDTLIEDVPYNGDPDAVVPMAGARAALDALREAGIAVGLVTNQSGVARGILTIDDVDAVNRRVTELLGPFDTLQICVHGPDDGCGCRKPQPGMIEAAADELGISTSEIVVVGDIGSDIDAAEAAGARGILVPTPVTRTDEIERAGIVVDTIEDAVWLLLNAEAR